MNDIDHAGLSGADSARDAADGTDALMDPADFLRLCREASFDLKLSDPDALGTQGYAIIDGISLGLTHNLGESTVRCYVDLGVVEPDQRLEVYEELLAMNTEMDRNRQAMFGLHADSGSALLHAEFAALRSITSSDLAGLLRRYADFAIAFRHDVSTARAGLPDASIDSFA